MNSKSFSYPCNKDNFHYNTKLLRALEKEYKKTDQAYVAISDDVLHSRLEDDTTVSPHVKRVREVLGEHDFLVRATGGVVAGGFILYAINEIHRKSDKKDVDIYFDDINMYAFFVWCVNRFEGGYTFNTQSSYNQSFFLRNNIYCRTNVFNDYERRSETSITSFDVIMCTDVYAVIRNFDLSFCSVYYDGRVVGGQLTDATRRHGYLNRNYVQYLLTCNESILKRLVKYKKRGYTIDLNIKESDLQCIHHKTDLTRRDDYGLHTLRKMCIESFPRSWVCPSALMYRCILMDLGDLIRTCELTGCLEDALEFIQLQEETEFMDRVFRLRPDLLHLRK